MGGGFVRGYSGGGFRVGVGGGYHGHYPGYRPGYYPQHGYYRPYPYRRYISPYAGYGGPVYSVGYYGYGYGSPFWSDIGTYGSSAYAYPYSPGPSISVITVPNLPDPGPSVVITNNRAPYEERSARLLIAGARSRTNRRNGKRQRRGRRSTLSLRRMAQFGARCRIPSKTARSISSRFVETVDLWPYRTSIESSQRS